MNVYNISGDKIGASSYDIPIITGELPTIFIESATPYTSLTKETASNGTVTFVDFNNKFTLDATIKLQGASSLAYAKKNLNITFYNEDNKKQKIIFNGWYPTNKIHLKANEFDYSMVRNSVGTDFAYKMMGKYLPSGGRGYISSFPALMYYNDEYMGCHTINLPQDGDTYNFTKSLERSCKNLAYRCGDTATDWMVNANWEYRGSVDETSDMRAVFTSFLNSILNPSSLSKSTIEEKFDKQTLLAYFVLADIMLAVDSLVNNWTLVTWDGSKWYNVWYDLDLSFGLGGNEDGNYYLNPDQDITTTIGYRTNDFWKRIVSLYSSDMSAMYAIMRNNGVDADNIFAMLHDFQSIWGWQNIQADRIKWESDKLNTNEIDKAWIQERFEYLDAKYSYTE